MILGACFGLGLGPGLFALETTIEDHFGTCVAGFVTNNNTLADR